MARMGGGHRGGGGGSFGGGRSGGSFGGGSFGGGGFGGHRGGGGLGGGPRPGGFGGPHHHPPHHHRPHGHFWGPGWGWGWGPRRRYYGPGGCVGGVVSSVIFIIVFMMIFSLAVFDSCSYVTIGSSNAEPEYMDITPSTVVRQPMPAQYLTEIDEYYYDGAGCLKSAAGQYSVEQSLKNFYAKTGVQPYLYIDDDLNGNKNPDFNAVEQFMNDKYYELFGDEGHILVLYFEYDNGEYNTWYMCGNDAYDRVMDDEACEIMLDFIDYHYQNHDTFDYADLFSKSFNDAADRIMGGKTRAGINLVDIIVFVVFAAVIIAIIVSIVKNYRKSKPGGGNSSDGGSSDSSSDDNMSEEDRRKERYRKKYGG